MSNDMPRTINSFRPETPQPFRISQHRPMDKLSASSSPSPPRARIPSPQSYGTKIFLIVCPADVDPLETPKARYTAAEGFIDVGQISKAEDIAISLAAQGHDREAILLSNSLRIEKQIVPSIEIVKKLVSTTRHLSTIDFGIDIGILLTKDGQYDLAVSIARSLISNENYILKDTTYDRSTTIGLALIKKEQHRHVTQIVDELRTKHDGNTYANGLDYFRRNPSSSDFPKSLHRCW